MTFQYHSSSPELVNILFGVISGAPALMVSIAVYVLTGLALYTIAKNRGLHKAWVAWVPVANVWLLGSIADQYRYVVRGQHRARRNWLLVLNILKNGMNTALVALALVVGIRGLIGSMYGMTEMLGVIALLALACGSITIVYSVLYFIALFDVYTSMDPDLDTLFLILSIFVPLAKPFFLFFCRNKESGMPPRRPVNPAEPDYL